MSLTPPEQAWLEHDEGLWRRAHEIANRHPGLDVSGVHHVLRNLERSPTGGFYVPGNFGMRLAVFDETKGENRT